MTALLAGWLLTYLVHSTLLLGLAWLASRLLSDRQLALREALWRVALFGGLVTASLQLTTGVSPFAGSWSLAESPSRATAPAESARGVSVAGLPTTAARSSAADAEPPRPNLGSRAWEHRVVRLWAILGLPLLALLAVSYLRLRWRLSTRTDLDDGHLRGFLRQLEGRSAAGGRRPPPVRLTRSARVGVPLARGVRRGEICLPDEALERLPIERQEIVVAHELAHLERRDPLWFGLTRVLERALFFQPLNTLARRQLQEISEFRCDDRAVAVTRRPISLAKCLTEVAEWSVRGRAALPVPTMAAGKTHLGRRVARLLERSYPMPTESLPRWLAPAALAVLLLTVLIAPGVSAHAPRPPKPAPPATPAAPVTPAPAESIAASPPVAPVPPVPALATVPAVPPTPAVPQTPDLDGAVAGGLAEELDPFDAFDTFDAFDAFDAFDPFDAFDAFDDLALELEVALAPMIAEISSELDPALAGEIAAEWAESLEFDGEQLERLRELAERLEERGHATQAETARLAELAERLIETARPSREELEQIRELERDLAATRGKALEEHRNRLRQLSVSERQAMERARAEIQRSLEERRELLERARQVRAESLRELDREHRERLRQEMLRSRELLREQLRQLDDELDRQDREEAEGERSQPFRE